MIENFRCSSLSFVVLFRHCEGYWAWRYQTDGLFHFVSNWNIRCVWRIYPFHFRAYNHVVWEQEGAGLMPLDKDELIEYIFHSIKTFNFLKIGFVLN